MSKLKDKTFFYAGVRSVLQQSHPFTLKNTWER